MSNVNDSEKRSNQQLKGKKSSMKLENGKTVNMILIMYMLRGKAKALIWLHVRNA